MDASNWIALGSLFVSTGALIRATSAGRRASKVQEKLDEYLERHPWTTKWVTGDKYRITNEGADAYDVEFDLNALPEHLSGQLKPNRFVPEMRSGSDILLHAPTAWKRYGDPVLAITWHRREDLTDIRRVWRGVLDFPEPLQQLPPELQPGENKWQAQHSKPPPTN